MAKFREYLQEAPHNKDDLLGGFTFEELIIAVQSNEKVVNAKSIEKVFNELLKTNIEDAKHMLKKNMKWIEQQTR